MMMMMVMMTKVEWEEEEEDVVFLYPSVWKINYLKLKKKIL